MSKVTITEAARLAGISRQYLYKKYINNGLLSFVKEGERSFIEISELIRVFPNISVASNNDTSGRHHMTEKETDIVNEMTNKDKTIKLLEQQLLEANEREKWLKSQIDELRRLQGLFLEDKSLKPRRKKFFGIF